MEEKHTDKRFSDIEIQTIGKILHLQGNEEILKRYCYLRKDDRGYYLEYAFRDDEVPFKYTVYVEKWQYDDVGRLFFVTEGTCDKSSGCSIGKPADKCVKNGLASSKRCAKYCLDRVDSVREFNVFITEKFYKKGRL